MGYGLVGECVWNASWVGEGISTLEHEGGRTGYTSTGASRCYCENTCIHTYGNAVEKLGFAEHSNMLYIGTNVDE
jgi:hypothetical protein